MSEQKNRLKSIKHEIDGMKLKIKLSMNHIKILDMKIQYIDPNYSDLIVGQNADNRLLDQVEDVEKMWRDCRDGIEECWRECGRGRKK